MEDEEVVRLLQDAPPARYTLKIKGFKVFSEIKKQQLIYKSEGFEVGGYKWKLLLYPTGKTENEGMEYISLSVAIADTPRRCVSAMLRVFEYNHANDEIRNWCRKTNAGRKARRYHVLKTEHGFDHVLPIAEFLDPKNGYLEDDCCAFGAEVHVTESARVVQSSILSGYMESGVHQWKIDEFSASKEECHVSTVFPVGPCNWKIELYPKGQSGKAGSVSVFLCKCDGVNGQTVYVKYKFTLQHQNGGQHHTFQAHNRFDDKYGGGWGAMHFVSSADLHDTSKGYLKKDTLFIEASIEAYFCETSKSYRLLLQLFLFGVLETSKLIELNEFREVHLHVDAFYLQVLDLMFYDVSYLTLLTSKLGDSMSSIELHVMFIESAILTTTA